MTLILKRLLLITGTLLLFALHAWAWPTTNKLAGVTLAWDPNPDTPSAGFIVYYGLASGAYAWTTNVAYVTNADLHGLTRGTTYYFAVTSYDTNGVESDFSNEISYTPPPPPVSLAFITCSTNKAGLITVTWSSSLIAESYVVYWGTTSSNYSAFTNVGQATSFPLQGLAYGSTYFVNVTQIDSDGQESAFGPELKVRIPVRPRPPTLRITGKLQASLQPVGAPWEDVAQLVEYLQPAEENKFFRVVMNSEIIPNR
jgi:hypothetical protein